MKWVLAGVLLGALMFPGAAAADRPCDGTIGDQRIDDDVVVRQGAVCHLAGTVVEANVLVRRDGRLTARDIRVDGNVQAEGASRVVVEASRVGGSVQVEQGGGADVRHTRVDADIQLFANAGPLQHVAANNVGGNVQARSNRGGVDITNNTIDGSLECQSNDPAPTGSGNVVHERRQGQCETLTPRPPSGDGGGGGGGGGGGEAGTPRLADRSLRAVRRGRSVRVPIRCRAGADCSGRVTLVRRGRRLGTRRFRISAGSRKTIRVDLNRRGRNLLQGRRRLKVTIAITASGQTVRRGATVRR
jgi:hypothetical protein